MTRSSFFSTPRISFSMSSSLESCSSYGTSSSRDTTSMMVFVLLGERMSSVTAFRNIGSNSRLWMLGQSHTETVSFLRVLQM